MQSVAPEHEHNDLAPQRLHRHQKLSTAARLSEFFHVLGYTCQKVWISGALKSLYWLGKMPYPEDYYIEKPAGLSEVQESVHAHHS